MSRSWSPISVLSHLIEKYFRNIVSSLDLPHSYFTFLSAASCRISISAWPEDQSEFWAKGNVFWTHFSLFYLRDTGGDLQNRKPQQQLVTFTNCQRQVRSRGTPLEVTINKSGMGLAVKPLKAETANQIKCLSMQRHKWASARVFPICQGYLIKILKWDLEDSFS